MSLRIRPFLLSLFLLSIFFSCDTPNDIGLEGIGDNSALGTYFTDAEKVEAATVLANDSILAFQKGNLLVGSFYNPAFGTVTAKSFLEIGLLGGTAGSTFTNAANATIDSVELVLDYDEYYGDTTENLTIRVHRLTEGFSEKASYFTNNSLAFNEGTTLGSKTFKPLPRKTKFIRKDIKNTDGQVIRVEETYRSYPARIRLNNSFGNEILALSGTNKLTSAQEFLKVLPGIALTAESNAKSVIGFNLRSTTDSTYRTYFTIYYKAGSATQYKYNFVVNPGNYRFSQITGNRDNSALAGLQTSADAVPSTATNNLTYLQESTGIKTKITFPELHTFVDRMKQKDLGNIIINRAELIVPVKSGSPAPSPYLYLFETNARNRVLRTAGFPRAVSFDGGGNLFNYTRPAPLVYDKEKQVYSLNVTSYVQAIIYKQIVQGRSASQNLILSPSIFNLTDPQLAGSVSGNDVLALQTLGQTVLSMEPGNPIKLRIYYSAKQ